MGGEAAARGLRTLSLDIGAMTLALGQELTPDGSPPFTTRFATLQSDWENGRSSTMAEFRGGGIFKVRQALWPTGGVAEANGAYMPAPPAQVALGQRTLRQAPHRLLLAALDPAATLTALPPRTREGRQLEGLRLEAQQDTVELWFDTATHRLAGIETRADDPILGDRTAYQSIERWVTATGTELLVPGEARTYVNGTLVGITATAAARGNVAIDTLAFAYPDSMTARITAAATAPSGAGPVIRVRLDSLAPGVYHVTGGTHHSIAVVQGDSTVLIEVPQSTERVRAILDTLAARFPRSPVRVAVVSHHHWDHAGGVRAALAARLPVVTQEGIVPFIRKVGATRRTIAPDGVERTAARHVVRGMRDSLAIGNGAGRIVLYEVPNSHATGLLAAYLPAAKALFIADIAPQATPVQQRELLAFVRARKLDVQRIAPAHGPVVPFADFERTTLAAGR
jgi:glyoxylase-like metal-dependent hydrolase (beta-lactamase superfamily II)